MTTEIPALETRGHWECSRRSPFRFRLQLTQTDRTLTAEVDGPLDTEHAPGFLRQVEPLCGPSRRLVVDLLRAPYIDSTGVRALLYLHDRLEEGTLQVLVQPGSRVERTLDLLGLLDRFRGPGTSA